jgi:hypothetical protein
MALAFPYDFATEVAVTGAELQAQFDAVGAVLDAGLTTAHMSPTAGILASQLAVSYEHLIIPLEVTAGDLTGIGGAYVGWPATTYLCTVPISGLDAEADWKVTGVSWACTDIGAGTGTFNIYWSHYNAGWVNDITTILNADHAIATHMGNCTLGAGTTLTFGAAGPYALRLYAVVADATAVSGAVSDTFCASVRLTRQINTGAT